ncbi:hypothetical protein HZH68_016180 [Vespula germanica]|uniref:Uncharacterized protein n=1 Tax=Vespula germanica TaxID=30212 RepID=A0A834MQT2_VESGE|nr:hypothetical protein HZH68_016180 [Vespula germanica]
MVSSSGTRTTDPEQHSAFRGYISRVHRGVLRRCVAAAVAVAVAIAATVTATATATATTFGGASYFSLAIPQPFLCFRA